MANQTTIKARRSTYTINNALRFKIVYDTAIRVKKEFTLNSAMFNCSPPTLRQKLNDGLLYLCNEWPAEKMEGEDFVKNDYLALRQACRFKHTLEGIKVVFPFTDYIISDILPTSSAERDRLIDLIQGKNKLAEDKNIITNDNIDSIKKENDFDFHQAKLKKIIDEDLSRPTDNIKQENNLDEETILEKQFIPCWDEIIVFVKDDKKHFLFLRSLNMNGSEVERLKDVLAKIEPKVDFVVTKDSVKISKL